MSGWTRCTCPSSRGSVECASGARGGTGAAAVCGAGVGGGTWKPGVSVLSAGVGWGVAAVVEAVVCGGVPRAPGGAAGSLSVVWLGAAVGWGSASGRVGAVGQAADLLCELRSREAVLAVAARSSCQPGGWQNSRGAAAVAGRRVRAGASGAGGVEAAAGEWLAAFRACVILLRLGLPRVLGRLPGVPGWCAQVLLEERVERGVHGGRFGWGGNRGSRGSRPAPDSDGTGGC